MFANRSGNAIPSAPLNSSLENQKLEAPQLLKQSGMRRIHAFHCPLLDRFMGWPPAELKKCLTQDIVVEAYEMWQRHKQATRNGTVKLSTFFKYRRSAASWGQRCGREVEIDDWDCYPVIMAGHLIQSSHLMSEGAWDHLRSSLVFAFQRDIDNCSHGHDQFQLRKAIVMLLCHRKPPLADARGDRVTRKRSISARDQAELLHALENRLIPVRHTAKARQREGIAQDAALFIQATLLTGLRPFEWHDAELFPASTQHLPDSAISPSGWSVLRVNTEKRKATDPVWIRELLLSGTALNIVRAHLDRYRSACSLKNIVFQHPGKQYGDRCTKMIRKVCNELWPKNAKKRATLYTFRHQARANFAAIFGGEITAVLMGHNLYTGENNYAGRHRTNLSSGMRQAIQASPTIIPARSAIEQAIANEQQRVPEVTPNAAPDLNGDADVDLDTPAPTA